MRESARIVTVVIKSCLILFESNYWGAAEVLKIDIRAHNIKGWRDGYQFSKGLGGGA
jgi:hypothetical protein